MECPKCGHMQSSSTACAKCGLIFDKYKRKTLEKRRRFTLKRSFFFVGFYTSILIIISGGILFLFSGFLPVPIAGIFSGAFLIAIGIVGIFLAQQSAKHFIELSERGINIANKELIPWEHIKKVELERWENPLYGSIIKSRWIQIEYLDKEKKKLSNVNLGNRVERFEDLHRYILDRIKLQKDGLENRVFTNDAIDSSDNYNLIRRIAKSPNTIIVC